MRESPNLYSRQWFEFFHVGIDEARTTREIEFVSQFAPLPAFRRVADVCCGMGRHARALSERGYLVTGIDRDGDALSQARKLGGGLQYVRSDIRDYRPAPESFDLVVIMGQSFGHFDSETNRQVFERLATGVRPGGRIILDLWNPDFFLSHQGRREFKMPGGVVQEDKFVRNDRLFVRLTYADNFDERFEWQLYTRSQMKELAVLIGLDVLLACPDFQPGREPSSEQARIQFVLERKKSA